MKDIDNPNVFTNFNGIVELIISTLEDKRNKELKLYPELIFLDC